jgi:ABC-type transport system involved in cytochrome c biogenesis permease subunit
VSSAVSSVLFIVAAVLYGIACALYLAFLARGAQRVEKLMTVIAHHSPFEDIHSTLTIASLGTMIGFLLAVLRFPSVNVLGAFITPITLLFLLASGLGRAVAPVPQEVRSMLLPLHVGVNVLGVVAFAIAFGASSAYVIQERMVRRKQLGGIFQRLPSLDVLDTVSSPSASSRARSGHNGFIRAIRSSPRRRSWRCSRGWCSRA